MEMKKTTAMEAYMILTGSNFDIALYHTIKNIEIHLGNTGIPITIKSKDS